LPCCSDPFFGVTISARLAIMRSYSFAMSMRCFLGRANARSDERRSIVKDFHVHTDGSTWSDLVQQAEEHMPLVIPCTTSFVGRWHSRMQGRTAANTRLFVSNSIFHIRHTRQCTLTIFEVTDSGSCSFSRRLLSRLGIAFFGRVVQRVVQLLPGRGTQSF
jgi:hypothetical protein